MMDTSYSQLAKEMQAQQIARYLDSDALTAEEFLSRPYEEQCTVHMLRLNVQHFRELQASSLHICVAQDSSSDMKIEGIPTNITHHHIHEVNIKVDPETMKAVRNITIIAGAAVLKYMIIKALMKNLA